MLENKKTLVLPKKIKLEMMKFFIKTSVPRMLKDKEKRC